MTIVTPSKWLAELVKESYLKEYPVKVINNGIDLNIFKPTPCDDMRGGNLNKFIVLFVSFGWSVYKGLDVIVELSKKLTDKYQIVVVGSDDKVDAALPSNVISIHRTQDQEQLAKVYSAANVFANPTREEMFGMVNIEALACGTPVVTFRTGGSPECIDDKSGIVVEKNNIDEMKNAITQICEQRLFSRSDCVKRAQMFEGLKKYEEYIELYAEIR